MDLIPEVVAATCESRDELNEYLTWVEAALENPELNMSIAMDNHRHFTNELRYYIVKRSSSAVVGAIGLLVRDIEVPFFEIGYWIRTSAVGNGYVSEAVGLLEHFAFKKHKANRLEIRMANCNTRSQKVAKCCGYKFEGELHNERRLPSGRLSNTLVYAKYDC